MEFTGQPNVATVPTGHSPTWFDAVNSEFYYDQHRKQDVHLKNNGNHHMFTAATGVTNPAAFNLHEHSPTMATAAEPMQTNMEYYQQPIPMEYVNDESFLPTPLSSSSIYVDDNSPMATWNAPCQGPQPWNFAHCYGFYGQAPCPLVNIIDMEDFM